MSTHLPGFQPFSGFLPHFAQVKLAISIIRVKMSLQLPKGGRGTKGGTKSYTTKNIEIGTVHPSREYFSKLIVGEFDS